MRGVCSSTSSEAGPRGRRDGTGARLSAPARRSGLSWGSDHLLRRRHGGHSGRHSSGTRHRASREAGLRADSRGRASDCSRRPVTSPSSGDFSIRPAPDGTGAAGVEGVRRASHVRVPDHLPMGNLAAAVSRLPPQSVILFVTLFRDGAGRAHIPHDAVARLADVANAPVYMFVDQYLGRGTVGGHLYSLERHGNSAAEVGLRVLRGEPPLSIPVRELESTANIFDARQLARWGIDERRLPANSMVRFREPTIWDQYSRYIIGGLALFVAQTLLIAGLLVQRMRRRRAEAELRRRLAQVRDLGRRLIVAQETERAHLARELHDDISQQMAVLQSDLRALVSQRAPASLQNLDHLVADTSARAAAVTSSLRDLSHRLHPGHLQLVGTDQCARTAPARVVDERGRRRLLERERASDDLSRHHALPVSRRPGGGEERGQAQSRTQGIRSRPRHTGRRRPDHRRRRRGIRRPGRSARARSSSAWANGSNRSAARCRSVPSVGAARTSKWLCPAAPRHTLEARAG